MTLADAGCAEETGAQMRALEHVRRELPRQWADAVLMHPSYMRRYVEASIRISWDPHSHYAEDMVKVCRTAPSRFAQAVSSMSAKEKRVFGKEVFSVRGCRPIALAEY